LASGGLPGCEYTTFAGSGQIQAVDGQGTNAAFYYPSSLAADGLGNLYVADGNSIRKISPGGSVVTWAGDPYQASYRDGTGTVARFSAETTSSITGLGIAADGSGNVYVADAWNHRIRKISTSGAVSTIAGSGNSGYQDGNGIFTAFSLPSGIAVDLAGNVFVSDWLNHVVRKISPERVVTTIAGRPNQVGYRDGIGTNANFNFNSSSTIPFAPRMGADFLGNIFVADVGNHCVRRISSQGYVITLAGSPPRGYADGQGNTAKFNNPSDVAADASGKLVVSDADNHRIRVVTIPESTLVNPNQLRLNFFAGLTLDGTVGRFYRIEIADEPAPASAWTNLAVIKLPQSPYLWFDTSSTNNVKRFYRAVLLP